MRNASLLLLFSVLGAALMVPLRLPVASAQPEPTPILGEPIVVTPLITAVPGWEPTAGVAPTATPAANTGTSTSQAPRAATEPDACEPNDTPVHACALALDAVSGPFTIVPESDQDFYRLDLPQEASIQTVVTVRATAGLDLALSARQGETLLASGAYSLTLAPDVVGSVVLRVENRDPRPAAGEQYRIEVRREIVPPSQRDEAIDTARQSDVLENNWSFETASAIAIGVVYDLSLVCPDPRFDACPGGDHDYLLVPVKAGMGYLIATFDLDPGVDTVVELFWGATTTAVAGNDDYAPGGPLSALHWTAPTDGLLGLRIAPRNGGLPQQLTETTAGYRFAVAPLASELARKLAATIRQQANVPTPTPTLTAAPSPAALPSTGGGGAPGGGGAAPAGSAAAPENISAGPAIIIEETVLRREPSERSTALASLPPETRVQVRGPVSGLWVSVETEASILPGWVRWSDLQRATAATATAGAGSTSIPATPAPHSSDAAPATQPTPAASSPSGSTTSPGHAVTVNALDPALATPPPPPVARIPFTLSVVVAASDRPATGGAALGLATPTPDLRQPVAQVRVQLVNVFGDLLAEGLTNAQGEVLLRRDMRPGVVLAVRIPAWGVELPLVADQARLIVIIPEAAR